MKLKSIIAAVSVILIMTGCKANKNKETVMEDKQMKERTTIKPDSINLGAVIGEGKTAGRVEVYDLDTFKLHVYYTQDVMNDASYIIEGKDSVVTMEQPLFKVNVGEFDAYLDKLNKPVAKRITDYHVGGTGDHEILMAKGMPEFVKGPVYGGMIKSFEQAFGDSMTALPTGKEDEVDFGTTHIFAGVPFEFRHGASSDFPAASIIIGKKAYYTHWTPAKAHMSHLQLSSREAVNAEIAEAERELNSGAILFIGGHGGATQEESVIFKIEYLNTIKKILGTATTPEAFVDAMIKAYPNLPGADGLGEVAKALYK